MTRTTPPLLLLAAASLCNAQTATSAPPDSPALTRFGYYAVEGYDRGRPASGMFKLGQPRKDGRFPVEHSILRTALKGKIAYEDSLVGVADASYSEDGRYVTLTANLRRRSDVVAGAADTLERALGGTGAVTKTVVRSTARLFARLDLRHQRPTTARTLHGTIRGGDRKTVFFTRDSRSKPLGYQAGPPDRSRPVVLIHGAWQGPSSWSKFKAFLERRGFDEVEAVGWPKGRVGIPELVQHYAAVCERAKRRSGKAPILIGHSFGGLFVQMLLDRGHGAAGVAIDSAPPRGVLPSATALIASLGATKQLLTGADPLQISLREWRHFWTHTESRSVQRASYRSARPTSRKVFLDVLRFRNTVRFTNAQRAPLLLIAGGSDRTVTPSMNIKNFVRYVEGSSAVVELKVFPNRTHWIVNQRGWEEVAEFAIDWAERNTPPAKEAPADDR